MELSFGTKTVFLFVFGLNSVFSFNINFENSRIFEGQQGSLFGFSIVLVDYNSTFWLYIGAPRGEKTVHMPSGYLRRDRHLGRVQMCSDSKCEDILSESRDSVYEEMFGFSMNFVQKTKDKEAKMVFCSPMWTDDKKYIKGLCVESFLANNSAGTVSLKGEPPRGPRRALSYFAAGFSLHSIDGEVLYGVPGFDNYNGSVFASKTPDVVDYKLRAGRHDDSLTGYAIYSGKFSETDQTYVIVGSPKYNDSGRVDIFRSMQVSAWEFIGDQMGSYFGATLCALDIDGNGKDDLLVAAPAYTSKTVSEGRVLLFLSESTVNSVSFKKPIILSGSLAANARFGTSISSVGDLDNDSFNDVAIGAPFEEDNIGCVYIYNGRLNGEIYKYSQRILGTQVKSNLRGFGWSISNSIDVDGNGYQDFAVSAILSDKVAILNGRPILKIFMNLTISPKQLALNLTESDQINITIHFKYQIKGNTFTSLPISYTLQVEPDSYPQSERLLLAENTFHGYSKLRNSISGDVTLELNQTKEIQAFAFLQHGISDFLSPIEFKLSNRFSEKLIGNVLLKPILKQDDVLVRKIGFAKDCGEDGICRSDLTLSLRPINDVIVNQTKKIEFKVVVGNDGQNAFLTMAKFFSKSHLRYMGVRMLEPPHHRVDCLETNLMVECDVSNPLRRNTNIKFILMYQLPTLNISAIAEGIWLQGFVTTKSQDINPANNQQRSIVELNMKAVPELTVNSEPFPVKYKKGESISINGSEIMTIYFDVQNLGPSHMPSTLAVFQIPMSLPNGEILFTDNDIEVIEPKSNGQFCSFLKKVNGEEGEGGSGKKDVTFPGRMTVSTLDMGEGTSYISETRKHARITIQAVAKCPDKTCRVLQCSVPEISARNKIRFIVKLNFTNARDALQTVDYLEISPEIKLHQNTKMKNLIPWREPPSVQVYRRFVAEMLPGRPINYIWVSAASSAGAICLVMIVWFLIWKFKCCVSKKHTEVKLMKRESLKRRTMRQVSRESGRYTPKEPGSPF